MDRKRWIIFYCLFFLFSTNCIHSVNKDNSAIIKEVDNLSSDAQRKEYLEQIIDRDQEIRNKESEIVLKYGVYSTEHQKIVEEISVLEDKNLERIEIFLEKYGHPTIEKHGYKASYAPWLIVHHSKSIEDRTRNFSYLYKAYISGDLEKNSFYLYLDNLYRMKHRERFIPPPGKDEVESIIERLGLLKN